MSKFSDNLARDMTKHSNAWRGAASYAATHLLPFFTKTVHGAGEMAKDFGVAKKMPAWFHTATEGAGNLENAANAWHGGLSRGGKAMATAAGFGAPIAGITMIPGLDKVLWPEFGPATNIGNALGQLSSTGDKGKQLAQQGGLDAVGSLYEKLQNSGYGRRRQLLNSPTDWSQMTQGAQEIAGKRQPQQMSGVGAVLNTLNPFSSGDISPWIQQQVRNQIPR